MATDNETHVCHVCGEEALAAATAECNWCDHQFHLNQRNDVEGQDCGEVWIDEQYLALQFACNACLAGGDAQAPARQSATKAMPSDEAAGRRRRYQKRT